MCSYLKHPEYWAVKSISKFKKTKIIQDTFCDNTGIKFEINNKKSHKIQTLLSLNNTLLEEKQITEEIKKELKRIK